MMVMMVMVMMVMIYNNINNILIFISGLGNRILCRPVYCNMSEANIAILQYIVFRGYNICCFNISIFQ